MKKLTLLLSLILISPNLFSQSITIGGDGIVRCKDVPIGTKQSIFGDEYEVVNRDSLIVRRNQGVDLTKMCVSNVTDMSNLFKSREFNQPIGNWDVSSVTTMRSMFYQSNFNQPIGNWDVSSVSDLGSMFMANKDFNQPIGSWDVSSVTDMSRMFENANFNQPIGDWNVSKVNDTHYMFYFNTKFNQPIGNWDVSSVTKINGMFAGTVFNQPIANWDISSVTTMSEMFMASEFNQDISNWDVSNVTTMQSMFYSSKKFNRAINNWDVSSVTDMRFMFGYSKFNNKISDWNVSNVTSMQGMFKYSIFNQNISEWCVPTINSEPSDFSLEASISPENKPVWGYCPGIPMIPLIVSPTNNSTDKSRVLQLIWSGDSFSTHYQLQVFEGFNPIIIDTLLETSTFTNIEPFKSNTTYYWRVKGINQPDSLFGEPKMSDWSAALSFTTGELIISPPVSITPSSPQNSSTGVTITPTLLWNQDSNSDSYTLQLSTDGFQTFIIDSTAIIDTTLTTPELEYNTTYSWRVRGTNTSGDGDWSEAWSFTTVDIPLLSPLLSTPFNEQVNVGTLTEFTWNEVESSVSYQLQISSDNQFSSFVFDSSKIGSSSFTLTEPLSENTTYFWRMKSISDNELRNSEWSDTLTFTTGVRTSTEDVLLPQEYTLSQNYPNPFNPSTQIQYALPEVTQVTLEVFNSAGQKVMELVNGQKSAGYHTATLDASGLSSGVYLYKLTTPSFTQTKKMLLIK